MWGWDPGSEIRDPRKNLFRITDPRSGSRVKKAPDPGSLSRIRIRNTAKKKRAFVRISIV
jgi:hypothetical protein